MLNIFLIDCLIAFLVCLFSSFILYIPVYTEARDSKNEKFHIKRKTKFDLDSFDSVKDYLFVLLLPLTVMISLTFKEFTIFSNRIFSSVSQTIAALALSMFGLILFMDFFKEKKLEQKNNIENYLNNHGYHTCISIMKYYVVFFIGNFVLANVDIGMPERLINTCKIEVLILFIIYVFYYFSKSLKLLLNYRKFENDKYSEVYNMLSKNYLNRPKQNIYVEDKNDLKQLVTTFADKFYKLMRKHKRRRCRKIEYVKCQQFNNYFKEKPSKLFISCMKFFVFIYAMYYILFGFLFTEVYFDICTYGLAGTIVIALYLGVAFLVFKHNIQKKFDKVNVFTRMLIARNRDYNKFVIYKRHNIKVEENLELWNDDFSKLCVLFFASTLNAFDQILHYKKNKDCFKNYMDFLEGILEVIESYCREIVSDNSDFSKKEKKNYSVPCYSILCILEKCILPPVDQAKDERRITVLNTSKGIISKNKKSLEKMFEGLDENSQEVAESITLATIEFSNKSCK